MSYRTEFPDFGELDVELPAGFEDTSWYQDAMPSFINEALGVVLMIDYREPARRMTPDTRRFNLYPLNKYSEPIQGSSVLETDNFAEVLQLLAAVNDSSAA